MKRKTASYRKQLKSYLTEEEMQLLLKAVSFNRHPERDAAIVLLMYRHGLRAQELCSLEVGDLDLKAGVIHVTRCKNGNSSSHPLSKEELSAVKEYLKLRRCDSEILFLSERCEPLTRWGITYLIETAGKRLGMKLNPHMLRHSCGYALANKGHDLRLIQDYLGHKNIQSTVRYTQINAARYAGLWK